MKSVSIALFVESFFALVGAVETQTPTQVVVTASKDALIGNNYLTFSNGGGSLSLEVGHAPWSFTLYRILLFFPLVNLQP